ncbi:zinc ABC transporter ATP-binding protein, putative [Babesia ovata]|uniref:Zinc ABC transporter ATP-binding protein, putative n=1 Tax=Babesia ovata TaxID=189622 RepID=A0A2H6KEL2_9APIC|nr:zinc ABC transporter ATP-binding protein, putative [Babesia ovata]GBE61427.1 zinc ABC transporter ATP-binding protein, putative [Babesia ovata]
MQYLLVGIRDSAVCGDADLINRPVSSFMRKRISSKYTGQKIDAEILNNEDYENSIYRVEMEKNISNNHDSHCYENKEMIAGPPIISIIDPVIGDDHSNVDNKYTMLKSISGGILQCAGADATNVSVDKSLDTTVDNVKPFVVDKSCPDHEGLILIKRLCGCDVDSTDYRENGTYHKEERSPEIGIEVALMKKEFVFGYFNSHGDEMAAIINEDLFSGAPENMHDSLSYESHIEHELTEMERYQMKRLATIPYQSDGSHDDIIIRSNAGSHYMETDFRRGGTTKSSNKKPNTVQTGAAYVTSIGEYRVPPYRFALKKLKSRFAVGKDQDKATMNNTFKVGLDKVNVKWWKILTFGRCKGI